MEFCRRTTNSSGLINQKTMEFLQAAKIGKCHPRPFGLPEFAASFKAGFFDRSLIQFTLD